MERELSAVRTPRPCASAAGCVKSDSNPRIREPCTSWRNTETCRSSAALAILRSSSFVENEGWERDYEVPERVEPPFTEPDT